MGALGLVVFAIANDFTAMNVVLPAIESELDADLSTTQWVVNGYALMFGVLIVPGGRFADMFGRTKVLYIGCALFGLFSLLGGFAPNIALLIAARVSMGIGAALMWPAILGLIYALLPDAKAGLAGGLVIGIAGIGNATGPVIAGALAEVSWRYIFFLNVPIVLVAAIVTHVKVHLESPITKEKVDYAGTALLALSLLALLGALTVAPDIGWTQPVVLGGVAMFVVLMGAFVLRERTVGEAGLVPPSVMGTPAFRWACIAVLMMSATFFTTLLYLPQFFSKLLEASTLEAGLMLLPFVATFAAASFSETWLLNRIGMKAVITIGAAGLFAGPLLIAILSADSAGFASVIPGMVVLGVGVGFFYSSVTTAALTALPPEKSSLAGGLLYMFQIAGGAVGLGISTAVFLVTSGNEVTRSAEELGITLSSSEVADVRGVLAGTDTSAEVLKAYPSQATQLTEVVRDSFMFGMRWAFILCAALSLIGLVIAATRVGGPLSRLGRDVEKSPGEAGELGEEVSDLP